MPGSGGARPPLVIGCGALAVELVALTRRAGLPEVDLTCLPASLHNRPDRIPAAVRARIRRARADGYQQLFVAYADCGTGGLLDVVLEEEGVARLEGAHCYEVYAGRAAFAQLHDEEPGTFYLTDFLVRNFDRLVIRGLGLDRHPELLPLYFGNYRRVVYLAQSEDAALTARARRAAVELGGLAFERRFTGLGELAAGVGFASTAQPSASARVGSQATNRVVPAAAASVFDSQSRFRAEPARIDAQAPRSLTGRQDKAANRPSKGRSGGGRTKIVPVGQGTAANRPADRRSGARDTEIVSIGQETPRNRPHAAQPGDRRRELLTTSHERRPAASPSVTRAGAATGTGLMA
jgi:hypothetical protein